MIWAYTMHEGYQPYIGEEPDLSRAKGKADFLRAFGLIPTPAFQHTSSGPGNVQFEAYMRDRGITLPFNFDMKFVVLLKINAELEVIVAREMEDYMGLMMALRMTIETGRWPT